MGDDVRLVEPAESTFRGSATVPGDKSLSHRALILAALATGESWIEGLGPGADVRSTAAAIDALGEIGRASCRERV